MYEVGSDNQGGTEPSDDEAPVLASASLVIDGLEAGTEYTFYVKAKDAAGNYAASGQLVYAGTIGNDDCTIALGRGVYVVAVDGVVSKVIM